MAAPPGWSQKQFDDWFAQLSAEALVASNQYTLLRTPANLQPNVKEWMASATTTTPLPVAWSVKEFVDWVTALMTDANNFYNQYILSRTPPALQDYVKARLSSAFPYPIDNLIFDHDWLGNQFYSGSLGLITAAQAFTDDRPGTVLGQGADGRYASFPTLTPRIVPGRGMWGETTTIGRVKFDTDLSNAVWLTTNMSIVQDLPSPFTAGTPLGWRITALTADATIFQTVPAFTIGSLLNTTSTGSFYLRPGDTLHGPVEITQDGVTWTDIRPQLLSTGVWTVCVGTPQPVSLVANNFGVRVRTTGDTIGFMLGNLDRDLNVWTPVIVPAAAQVNRTADLVRQIMANYPPLWNLPAFTLVFVGEPRQKPLPTPDLRRGWTCFEFNKPFTIKADGYGHLDANAGSPGRPGGGNYDRLTIFPSGGGTPPAPAAPTGNWMAVDARGKKVRLVVGTGAQSYTDIIAQTSGTAGLDGTYDVYSTLGPFSSTANNIFLQGREKDAMGLGFNAANKGIDQNYELQIGLTATNEYVDQNYGYDPKINFYYLNRCNAMAFSVDFTNPTLPRGNIALRGDVTAAENGPNRFVAAPVFTSDSGITWLCQGPNGGGNFGGVGYRAFCYGRYTPDAELAALTTNLQAAYDKGYTP